MKTCKHCQTAKEETAFSWNDGAHSRLDIYCHPCRASLKRQRYRPKHAIKPPTLPHGLSRTFEVYMTDVEAAYVAGLIDGEGCIMSSYPTSRRRPLALAVTMIHKPTVDWLSDKCGGGTIRHRSKQGNARPAWNWQVKAVRSRAILQRILPYMVTKKEEAEVALRLADTIFLDQHRGKVAPETHLIREALGQQLRNLKKREWPHD